MKYLDRIILISLISSLNFVSIEMVYSAEPVPTEYDEQQNDLIDTNINNIADNADDIADVNDNIADNLERIDTNTSNVTTNITNIFSNDTDIAAINESIGDRNYDTYYVTDGESLTSSINSLDQQMFINRTDINNNSQRLDNHEGRIEDLEETEVNLVGEVQFIRKKNQTISTYIKYDVRHNTFPEVGLKLTVGLDKSWTQEELERLETKLNKIEKLLQQIAGKREPIETKMVETENGYSIVIDEVDTAKLLKKF